MRSLILKPAEPTVVYLILLKNGRRARHARQNEYQRSIITLAESNGTGGA